MFSLKVAASISTVHFLPIVSRVEKKRKRKKEECKSEGEELRYYYFSTWLFLPPHPLPKMTKGAREKERSEKMEEKEKGLRDCKFAENAIGKCSLILYNLPHPTFHTFSIAWKIRRFPFLNKAKLVCHQILKLCNRETFGRVVLFPLKLSLSDICASFGSIKETTLERAAF